MKEMNALFWGMRSAPCGGSTDVLAQEKSVENWYHHCRHTASARVHGMDLSVSNEWICESVGLRRVSNRTGNTNRRCDGSGIEQGEARSGNTAAQGTE